MAKPKKLTVKIYENRQIVKPYQSEFVESQFWPLYLTVTYDRKIKNLKSPTFEYLERLNFGYDLITEDWEAIRKNDERLLVNFKSIIEARNQTFSLDQVSQTNPDFQNAKITLYDFYSSHLRSDLFKVLQGNPWAIQASLTAGNLVAFSFMLGELKPEIFEDLKKQSPESHIFLNQINELASDRIYPFMVDLWIKEPFLDVISSSFSKGDQNI
ncbi:MAG: hypothetical protein KGZ90_05070 [Algoriphagus sp.]|nr:hypothetical protein [Algoriphagus sp.]